MTSIEVNVWSRLRVVALLLAMAVIAACGPGPKSQSLDDLERQLQDPSANDVKDAPGASKLYREARSYRRLSLEAWEEGKSEISQEYATLGMLKYRTAAAIFEQHEAKARLDQANSKVTTTNPEIKALNQEQLKLAEEVNALEVKVAQARRAKEEAERRRKALASQQNAAQGNSNDAAKQAELRNKMNDVESAKRAADAVNASTHAPEKYNPAANALKSLQLETSSGNASDPLIADAVKAAALFREAEAAAKPAFENEQEKQNPTLRRQKLAADAQIDFGGSNVITEAGGVRIVLAGAFDQGSSTVSSAQSGKLAALVKLAQTYDEFSIYIEGYTSKGDATENLGLSQLRARNVKDHLTAKGVKSSRVEDKGQGQDRPRFGSSSSQNDRVEVVFRR